MNGDALHAKSLTILGSTGSIGQNTLDVVSRHPQRYRVHALAARHSDAVLAEQIKRFQPSLAILYDSEAARRLRENLPAECQTTVLSGMEGLIDAATAPEVQHVVAGIVGAVGLRPTYAAVQAGKELSIANKETLVLAGEVMMAQAARSGSTLLPMDSEHNAVFQCLQGNRHRDLERIVLTASGGPFRDLAPEAFESITREQALAHPNWSMGPKITIDSATMMNKGLEVIEARWLFGLEPEQIQVLIHRQSIVHSMVEFVDGSVIAQLGLPDMRTPIAHCLAHPERLPLDLPRLNLVEAGRLEFSELSEARYPGFFLALEALRLGGGVPAALNGANEAVVAAYLDGAFPFTGIAAILKQVMSTLASLARAPNNETLSYLTRIETVEDAIEADRFGRELAITRIEQP